VQDAMKLGHVTGIFNLAVALRDGIFENQVSKMFAESLAPKADATRFLDEISRKFCPDLKHFVVFSSVSCGRGNAGQSNYGMANSIMERIMEQRAKLGLPGKAIQWGAIGDVGLLASLHEKNLDMTIGGTLTQGIVSCLEVLDSLLTVDETIVASMIVAEKRVDDSKKGNILDTIFNIMSIRDRKAISMETSLSQLGMDSLMGVEIQQVLERDYDTVLSPDEMRTITLSQLEKRVHSKETVGTVKTKISDGLEFLMTSFGDEKTSDQTILKLKNGSEIKDTKILIVPGIEGMAANVWHEIANELKHPTYILQLGNAAEATTLEEIFDAVAKVSLKF
jgi:fatty acid synthase, animal type